MLSSVSVVELQRTLSLVEEIVLLLCFVMIVHVILLL